MKQYHIQNRPNRELYEKEEINQILIRGKFVTIALCRNNEPYIVTLSYGYDRELNTLYFHAAKKGLKLDFIRANPLVCATVIEDGGYIPDECSHNYRSIVFWGNMSVVEVSEEKHHGMSVLLHHLEEKPEVIAGKLLKSDQAYERMEVLKLEIVQIHGKAGK